MANFVVTLILHNSKEIIIRSVINLVTQNQGYNKKEYIKYMAVFVVTFILCNSSQDARLQK